MDNRTRHEIDNTKKPGMVLCEYNHIYNQCKIDKEKRLAEILRGKLNGKVSLIINCMLDICNKSARDVTYYVRK